MGLPASTIRYYESKRLIPGLVRKPSGIREFSEADIDWLRMIEHLKMSGMTIGEISDFRSSTNLAMRPLKSAAPSSTTAVMNSCAKWLSCSKRWISSPINAGTTTPPLKPAPAPSLTTCPKMKCLPKSQPSNAVVKLSRIRGYGKWPHKVSCPRSDGCHTI